MTTPNVVNELHPGDTLLVDSGCFDRLEQAIGDFVDAGMTGTESERFLGMTALSTVLGFREQGNPVGLVRMTVMEEPFQQLVRAVHDGWRFSRSGGILSHPSSDPLVQSSYFGLLVEANLSPRDQKPRSLRVPVWYGLYPPAYFHRTRSDGTTVSYPRTSSNNGGSSVRRISAVPQVYGQALERVTPVGRVFKVALEGAGIHLEPLSQDI